MSPVQRSLVGALLAVCGGCADDANCSAVGGRHTQLYVLDSATHAPICDSLVTSDAATDGGFAANTDRNFCGFVEVSVAPGSYLIRVAAPHYMETAQPITVSTDQCGTRSIQPEGARDGLPGFGDTVSIGLEPR